MDIKSLIQGAEKEQKDHLAEYEKRRSDERQRNALNAAKTSSHLREIVLPVFKDADRQINESSAGVSRIEVRSRLPAGDADCSAYELTYILSVFRIMEGKKLSSEHVFSIEGDSESATASTSTRFADSANGWTAGPVTRIRDVTTEWA